MCSYMRRTIFFTLNGQPTHVHADDERLLLWVLRYDLGLTGTKYGCGEGLCGSCTVVVDNEAMRACTLTLRDVADKTVLTIEGLEHDGKLHPIQEALLRNNAFQCGYCAPGIILSAYALLQKTPQPTFAQILKHMDDNLCRCGSHTRVVEAIQEAAGTSKEPA
jgi:aerobic-type carbon monoxide dehydrogenase small subunit (CoxS/CutS family)